MVGAVSVFSINRVKAREGSGAEPSTTSAAQPGKLITAKTGGDAFTRRTRS